MIKLMKGIFGINKQESRWVAFEKGTHNEIARSSTYEGLIRQTGDRQISYLKLPPNKKHIIFYN